METERDRETQTDRQTDRDRETDRDRDRESSVVRNNPPRKVVAENVEF